MNTMRHLGTVAAGVALALGGFIGAAFAQRDAAYEQARAAGQIGEKMDGYLGIVGSGPGSLRAMVDDLNIKRKAGVCPEGAGAARHRRGICVHLGLPADRADQVWRKVRGARRIVADAREQCAAARSAVPVIA